MKLQVGVYVSTCVTCRNGALITALLHYTPCKSFPCSCGQGLKFFSGGLEEMTRMPMGPMGGDWWPFHPCSLFGSVDPIAHCNPRCTPTVYAETWHWTHCHICDWRQSYGWAPHGDWSTSYGVIGPVGALLHYTFLRPFLSQRFCNLFLFMRSCTLIGWSGGPHMPWNVGHCIFCWPHVEWGWRVKFLGSEMILVYPNQMGPPE